MPTFGHVQHSGSFFMFEELPELAKLTIFRQLDLPSAASLSTCNRSLHALGRDIVWRNYGCRKCGCCFFHPNELDGGVEGVNLQDGDAFCVATVCNVVVKQPQVCADYSLIHFLIKDFGLPLSFPGFAVTVRHLFCAKCTSFVGLRVEDISRTMRPAGFRPNVRLDEAMYAVKEKVQGMSLLPKGYLARFSKSGEPDKKREDFPSYCCKGGVSTSERDKGCGNVLFRECDVLSSEHRWDVGNGTEEAYYVNIMEPESFYLMNEREESLCQGEMLVADLHCARCKANVGWKFCGDLEEGGINESQVGRFGVVASAFTDPTTSMNSPAT